MKKNQRMREMRQKEREGGGKSRKKSPPQSVRGVTFLIDHVFRSCLWLAPDHQLHGTECHKQTLNDTE